MSTDNQDYYEMAFEIDCSGGYLNGKETDFIEDVLKMADASVELSEKQRAWIQRIWDRVIGG